MKATTSLATSCRRLLLWGVLTLQCLFSTAQKRFTADVEQQAEKILSQMTLDEKLSYIGVSIGCIPVRWNVSASPD